MNKQICSKYYHVLVRQDHAEQREGFEALVKGLDTFGQELAGGPFYAGQDTPGLVDYALFPWAHRLPVFEHYRGDSFTIPDTTPGLKAYHAWLAAMEARPRVKKTCPPWEDYLQHIGGARAPRASRPQCS